MIKFVSIPLLALALSLPAAASAQGFSGRKFVRIPVLPIDANTFEAVENDGAAGSHMWCAAARFAREYLKERGGDLFVKQALGPSAAFPGRKSVIFTTQPVPDAFNTYTHSIRNVGQKFSQAHGYAICRTQERERCYVSVNVVRR